MVLTVSLVLDAAQPAIGFGDMVAGLEPARALFGISARRFANLHELMLASIP